MGCWVRGWSSLAPLGCLLLGSDCQRRGVRIPSEESYLKDFFLQFSDPEREVLAAVLWLSGSVGLSLPAVAYVVTGLV